MTKAIIFDFDGTLANTKAFAYQVYSKITEKYGVNKLNEDEFDHLKTLSLLDKFRAHDVSVFRLPKLARQARKEIGSIMHEVKPFDGVIELLKKLDDDHFQLFIVSSNSTKNINIFTEQFQLNIFRKIYGRAKYLKKEKVLRKLLKQFNLKTDEVIYIGDEIRDITSCHHMGIPIISVTWGFDDMKFLLNEEPEYIAQDVKQLEKIIYQLK